MPVCALRSTNLLSLLIILYNIFAGPPTLWIFLLSRFVPPVTFLEETYGGMGFRALRHRTWGGVSALLGGEKKANLAKPLLALPPQEKKLLGKGSGAWSF